MWISKIIIFILFESLGTTESIYLELLLGMSMHMHRLELLHCLLSKRNLQEVCFPNHLGAIMKSLSLTNSRMHLKKMQSLCHCFSVLLIDVQKLADNINNTSR